MIRVLLADDQAAVRGGFAALIGAQEGMQVAGEAANGREAIDLARRTFPHVVLMDIRMPVLDGVEATRADLRRRAPGGHARPRPHHVRPRRVRLWRTARRSERLPAQGHAPARPPAGDRNGRRGRRAARPWRHAPADRGVRRAPGPRRAAASPGRAHGARARGHASRRPGNQQRRDRRPPRHQPADRQDTRQQRATQARLPRPRRARGVRLRERARDAGRDGAPVAE